MKPVSVKLRIVLIVDLKNITWLCIDELSFRCHSKFSVVVANNVQKFLLFSFQ